MVWNGENPLPEGFVEELQKSWIADYMLEWEEWTPENAGRILTEARLLFDTDAVTPEQFLEGARVLIQEGTL